MRRSHAVQDGLPIALAGEDNAHGAGIESDDVFEQLRSVHAGHSHVGQHHVEGLPGKEIEGLGAAFGELHRPFAPEASEHAMQGL